jgi:hypothetical protein
MDKSLPLDARILISASELRVLPSDSFQGYVFGDAGGWITPLTNRYTISLPYNTDLGEPNTLAALCKMGINHVYVGETGFTFDDLKIRIHPDWYKILLSMPKVRVYQVIGCN